MYRLYTFINYTDIYKPPFIYFVSFLAISSIQQLLYTYKDTNTLFSHQGVNKFSIFLNSCRCQLSVFAVA